jgi:threonine dehydrogenase-like Zn-dependent dehydrogenase
MGHGAIGIAEEVGRAVRTLEPGELVVMPVACSGGS